MDIRTPAALLFAVLLSGAAHAQSCASDLECQDGSWCNGTERCEGNPGYGMCMPAARPMCSSRKVCDENGKRCLARKKVDKLLTPCAAGEVYSDTDKKCVPKSTGN
jgi:hypothetical protein